MPDPVTYDNADYHYGDEIFEEENLPTANGGTHIGMFLAWILIHGLESKLLRKRSSAKIDQVRNRQITGRDFLFSECDERMLSEDLNDEGNAFARSYYNDYLNDFTEFFAAETNSPYKVADSWANYDRVAAIIDARYRDFKQTYSAPVESSPKPKWKFWK